MLGLPKNTEISIPLHKTKVYEKFNMNNAAKEKFDADISRIFIVNEVSPNTVTIEKGEDVQTIFLVYIVLKNKNFSENTISQLNKLINQKMIFILDYGSERKVAIYQTKLLSTKWMPIDEFSLSIKGLNIDSVWENFVIQIGNVVIEEGNTIDEQIAVDEQKEKIKKEIVRLEKQARAEKQPNKKFDLVQKIKNLKMELCIRRTYFGY